MYRLIHIESGFEFSFATLEEAIEYLETYDRQEEFEIRRQTARSIFLIIKRTYVRWVWPGRRKRTGAYMGEKKFFIFSKKGLTG